ncbi:organic solute transporter Ostalpha-domain-containing protein [Amylocystis lapponica]|nr:organic solute transporter Ostalpha-domain-containing protein [Amylocystis lapponica]
MVVRIMLMVPLYAISSFISLFSLDAAFFIDVVRDIYEAFVIYCFLDLLIAYLGGERSLLILLHGRPPKYPVFPANLLWREVDVSDPYTFLFLKRGVLQYVQVKPILALATVILKLLGKYNDGDLRANSGYLYVSIVYNASICLSLYCLAMFWMCVNDDLQPFRPLPKFLCVKGILFFSFWQSLAVSILVAAGAIKKLGPYTDNEHISLGLTDTLICLEMPLFAVAHLFAFATRDFVDPHVAFVARMPVVYAARDAFGLRDVVEDSKATLRGEGMDYRAFEPSEGNMHQGAGRDRRIRAGLRYSQGGKRKYWLPQASRSLPGAVGRRLNRAVGRAPDEVYAPLLPEQEDDVVHTAADLRSHADDAPDLFDRAFGGDEHGGLDLPFGEPDEADEELFEHSKRYVFGDYNYPCVDISTEVARRSMWDEEERILRDERGAYFSETHSPARVLGAGRRTYGAVESFQRGAVRERVDSDSARGGGGKGKTREDTPVREVVIDKEGDRPPETNMGEVRLRWTGQGHTPVSSPRLRTLSNTQPALLRPESASPLSSGSPNGRPLLSPRAENEQPVLPPDAVDLVVEDKHAAQEEMTHERRKGEPAVRRNAGLHKVYRRGYVADDGGSEVLVTGEAPLESGREFPGNLQDTMFSVGDEVDEGLDTDVRAVEDLMIAQAETPPLHARIALYSPDDLNDENPWA